MSRRYLLTTVGIILGALALGLYFTRVNAADKSVTTQMLLTRINTLEQRVHALEQRELKGGGPFLLGNPNGKIIAPDQLQGDGFGPVRIIPVETPHSPK